MVIIMQYDKVDYYQEHLIEEDNGCCLLCEHQEPDCLCYACKCKKCYWYEFDPDIDEKGHCEHER